MMTQKQIEAKIDKLKERYNDPNLSDEEREEIAAEIEMLKDELNRLKKAFAR